MHNDCNLGVQFSRRAVNNIWKESIKEHYCVDQSSDMNTLAQLLLQGTYFSYFYTTHIVASELKNPICHSNECQIGSFSSEATICCIYYPSYPIITFTLLYLSFNNANIIIMISLGCLLCLAFFCCFHESFSSDTKYN